MSNKIVPSIYRTVIDEVIAAIKPEFDEYGVPEEVLAELQERWENKVVASHVADFEPPQQTPQMQPPPPPHHSYQNQPPPMHMVPNPQHPYPPPHNPYNPVKSEPVDSRYMLSPPQPQQYTLPPLPGPPANGRPPQSIQPAAAGATQQNVLSFPTTQARYPPQPRQPQQQRIPQVDGPSSFGSDEDEDDEDGPSQPQYAPRPSHPSLPQPKSAEKRANTDEEAINSDLDDSDTDNEANEEEGTAGETDIVFCTYDKVARVKNKWKTVLKDGMVHVNGRDYLFAKCTGEFEW